MTARSPCLQHNPRENRRVADVLPYVVRQTIDGAPWNRPRKRTKERVECSPGGALPCDGLLPDERLSEEERAFYSTYLTPRRGFNGAWVWPIDELYGGGS